MSTTQELITPAALNYIANETACQLDDPLHAERLRTLIPDALRQAADRLASLSAENAALKAKLAGVDENRLEVAEAAFLLAMMHERGYAVLHIGGENQRALRAAIAAYLAAVGGGE